MRHLIDASLRSWDLLPDSGRTSVDGAVRALYPYIAERDCLADDLITSPACRHRRICRGDEGSDLRWIGELPPSRVGAPKRRIAPQSHRNAEFLPDPVRICLLLQRRPLGRGLLRVQHLVIEGLSHLLARGIHHSNLGAGVISRAREWVGDPGRAIPLLIRPREAIEGLERDPCPQHLDGMRAPGAQDGPDACWGPRRGTRRRGGKDRRAEQPVKGRHGLFTNLAIVGERWMVSLEFLDGGFGLAAKLSVGPVEWQSVADVTERLLDGLNATPNAAVLQLCLGIVGRLQILELGEARGGQVMAVSDGPLEARVLQWAECAHA